MLQPSPRVAPRRTRSKAPGPRPVDSTQRQRGNSSYGADQARTDRLECNADVNMDANRRRTPLWRPALTPFLLVAIVSGATLSTGSEGRSLLVASARHVVEQGQIWRLVTSGILIQQPYAESLASFALLGCLAFVVCGRRVFWCSALIGHVGSALPLYLLIGIGWSFNPTDFQNAWSSPDYGVSAISAAWLGSIAAAGWRLRGTTWTGKGAIALSCLTVATFAYTLRPGLTILASEHVLAFLIGVGLVRVVGTDAARANLFRDAAVPVCRRIVRTVSPQGRVDLVVAGTLVATLILIGGSLIPSAVADLGRRLLDRRDGPPGCIASPQHVPLSMQTRCQTVRDAPRSS